MQQAGTVPSSATKAPMRPPRNTVGVLGWLRANLFSSITNSLLTLVGLYVVYKVVSGVLSWAVFHAVFTGADGKVCQPADVGACWPFVTAKFGQFMYGRYPDAERWRVNLVYGLGLATLIPLMVPAMPGKRWLALFGLLVYPIVAFVLLVGGMFGLPETPTELWGGLLVTLVVASVGIAASFPIGIVLALGRRSQMPIARWASIVFIEFVRAVPLITVLFMSSVMLPLFLPEGVNFDKLLRALIGITLFEAAYMAEVVRGGLQAIPKGQYEAAAALGLGYWKMMGLVILPQALKLVIPGIVNTLIALFKDTTLVIIIGLFDLLNTVHNATTDPKWLGYSIEGYVFAASVFWIFCFSMSRYSQHLEKRLHTGHRR